MSLDTFMLPRTTHDDSLKMSRFSSKVKNIFGSSRKSSSPAMADARVAELKQSTLQTTSSSIPSDDPPAYSPIDLSPVPASSVSGSSSRSSFVAEASSVDARLGALTLGSTPQPLSLARSATASTTATDDIDQDFSRLGEFDTVFVIDDSFSMTLEDMIERPNGTTRTRPSRWRETQKVLSEIAPICAQYDEDGIDIHFLHHNCDDAAVTAAPKRGAAGRGTSQRLEPVRVATRPWRNITSAAEVDRIFQRARPWGSTPLGEVLDNILTEYVERYKCGAAAKKLNIIVITDGQPDKPRCEDYSLKVKDVIVRAAHELAAIDADSSQVGIQFIQVGKDEKAGAYLEKLDNKLASQEGIRDMVDTFSFESRGQKALTRNGVLKAVLGAVSAKLDRERQGQQHHL